MQAERRNQLKATRRGAGITFDRYHRHGEINDYLDSLHTNSASSPNVTVKTVGKSYEGRDIKTITITKGDGKSRNSVFIDAAIHAREWISPATALYLISQLVDPQSNYSRLLDDLDFVIMPVINADGYEYSHEKKRFWRKSRSPNSNGLCVGTDHNRNFDFHWGGYGSSANPCAQDYRGSKPLSEVESQVLRDAVVAINASCKFYLTLHSYGRYLIYPWGWTSVLPDTWKDLDAVAKAGAEAIRKATGATYKVGTSTSYFGPVCS